MAARQMFRQAFKGFSAHECGGKSSSAFKQLLRCTSPFNGNVQQRNLNLQEYQSKELMRQNGVTVQKFVTISDLNQLDHLLADQKSQLFNCQEYVIKAQILAGGRGKGHFLGSQMKGGVKLTREKQQIKSISAKMLNDYLVTAQTGEKGVLVRKVMIAEALDIDKELYLAILLDRDAGGPLLVACEQGN